MGVNIGRAFKISDEGNTRASNFTYNASNITKMGDSVGIYAIAGAEIAGTVHKAAEVSD
jgi:hypothetical protein